MLLSQLFASLGAPAVPCDPDITAVTDRLENVAANTLFVCIRGKNADGHRFADAAVQRGARAVVSEMPLPLSVPVLVTGNTRVAFALLCRTLYGAPDGSLSLTGVTGTNGKTTTSLYIKHIIESTGAKCAYIGTAGFCSPSGTEDFGHTTPDAAGFYRYLAKARDDGCGYCVVEVSSQALDQYRTYGASFSLGVMTNVGRDHLDYHGSLAALVAAKTRLCEMSRRMLINADDAAAPQFLDAAGKSPVLTYSCRSVPADVSARDIRFTGLKSRFMLVSGMHASRVELPAPGLYSVYNAVAAAGAALALGVGFDRVVSAMGTLPAIPGRMETFNVGGRLVAVDFAHTPAALDAVLSALAPCADRLTAVFGCGGDPDPGKRPLMGAAAAKYCDLVVLTDDNPRTEDPAAIIDAIARGIGKRRRVLRIPDRRLAIETAIENSAPGDAVLIAGKGDERTQTVGGRTLPFSDRETVLRLCEKYFTLQSSETNCVKN